MKRRKIGTLLSSQTHINTGNKGAIVWGVEVLLERCRGYITPLSSHVLDSLQPCLSHDIKVTARSTDWGSDYEV